LIQQTAEMNQYDAAERNGGKYLLDGGARDAGACVFRMDGDAFLRDG